MPEDTEARRDAYIHQRVEELLSKYGMPSKYAATLQAELLLAYRVGYEAHTKDVSNA